MVCYVMLWYGMVCLVKSSQVNLSSVVKINFHRWLGGGVGGGWLA